MSRRLDTGDDLESTLRRILERLRALEANEQAIVGEYLVEVDDTTGDLTATNTTTGTVTILASP